jgi:hypothetical protein
VTALISVVAGAVVIAALVLNAPSGTADRCYGCEQYTAAADLVRVEIGANICADFCRDCAAHILRGRHWRHHGTV